MNQKNFIYSGILILLSFILFACEEKQVISEETFLSFYSDMVVAQDSIGRSPAAIDSIHTLLFPKYGIDSTALENTLQYYNDNPDLWEPFFDKAMKRMEEKKAEAEAEELNTEKK